MLDHGRGDLPNLEGGESKRIGCLSLAQGSVDEIVHLGTAHDFTEHHFDDFSCLGPGGDKLAGFGRDDACVG